VGVFSWAVYPCARTSLEAMREQGRRKSAERFCALDRGTSPIRKRSTLQQDCPSSSEGGGLFERPPHHWVPRP
jgi:hypothetical protein